MSGVVVSAPAGSGFATGQAVVTLSFGAHAEQVAAVPEATFPLPAGLSMEEGAALPLNALTAYAALRVRGRLQRDETLLVQGAAGGVGSAAIQVGKALGARVLAVVSSDEKAQTARRVGADEVFRTTVDWRAQVLEASDGGVDVAFDPVGGERFGQTLRCMRSQGRLVVVGFAEGAIPQLAVNRLLLRNVDVCGCTWSVLAEAPDGLRRAMAELTGMVRDGFLRPVVDHVAELAAGADALRALERREVNGKLVLRVSS